MQPLTAELKACEDSVRPEREHRRHLARHAETALVASLCAVTDTQSPATVRIYEVRHPASLLEVIGFHEFKTRHRVHDRVTFLLHFKHLVNDFTTLFHIKSKVLCTWERRMEID